MKQIRYFQNTSEKHFGHSIFGLVCNLCKKECTLSPYVDDKITPLLYWSKRKEQVLCSDCSDLNPLMKFRKVREWNDIPFYRTSYSWHDPNDPLRQLTDNEKFTTFEKRFCTIDDEKNEQRLISSDDIVIIGHGRLLELLTTSKLAFPIEYANNTYQTAEHLFQALKYLQGDATQNHLEYAEYIRKCSGVMDAIALGKQEKYRGYHKSWINSTIGKYQKLGVAPFSEWDKIKVQWMKAVLEMKFYYDDSCANILRSTGNKKIVFDLSQNEMSGLDVDFYGKYGVMAELLQDIRYELLGYNKLTYPEINDLVLKLEAEKAKNQTKQPPGSVVKDDTPIVLTKEQRERIESNRIAALARQAEKAILAKKKEEKEAEDDAPIVLTKEQKERIESNRIAALARQAEKVILAKKKEEKETEANEKKSAKRKLEFLDDSNSIQPSQEIKSELPEENEYDEQAIISALDEEDEIEPSQKRIKNESTPVNTVEDIPGTMPTLESLEYEECSNQD